jgi:hypothetical protein
MWRPIKLLLSDWWPQLQKRRTDENLSRMQVEVRYAGAGWRTDRNRLCSPVRGAFRTSCVGGSLEQLCYGRPGIAGRSTQALSRIHRTPMHRCFPFLVVTAFGLLGVASAQTQLAPAFRNDYVLGTAGSVSMWPGGALTITAEDPGHLLLGANPGTGSAILVKKRVTRDAAGHVTGVVGPITQVANVGYMGPSMAQGPGGLLFCATLLTNLVSQIAPGNWSLRREIDLAPFGLQSEDRGIAIVPTGHSTAGELRLVSNSGIVHAFQLVPDGNGTFDLVPARPPVAIGYGSRHLVFVPPGSVGMPDHQYVLVTEYNPGQIVRYQLDANAMPIAATRQAFCGPFAYPVGACIDPVTGDLLQLSHGWGTIDIARVEGFGRCGTQSVAGFGIAGTHGAPTIAPTGCAGRGEVWAAQIANGLANAPGFVIVGIAQQSVPFLGGTLYVAPLGTFFHALDASGQGSLALTMPLSPTWNGLEVHAQAVYLDPAAMFGVSATNALHSWVR